MKLDQLTLDAMVCGTECDPQAWAALLLDPDREEKWRDAVERREKLNCFCTLVARWPNVAKSLRLLKKLPKTVLQPPRLTFWDGQTDAAFTAVMGGESVAQEGEWRLGDLPWGSQKIIEVTAPQRIAFHCDYEIAVHYEYSGGTGWITSKDCWDLDGEEGPVILTFCHINNRTSDAVEEVCQAASSVATVVFLPV